jgi:hypothetical protein
MRLLKEEIGRINKIMGTPLTEAVGPGGLIDSIESLFKGLAGKLSEPFEDGGMVMYLDKVFGATEKNSIRDFAALRNVLHTKNTISPLELEALFTIPENLFRKNIIDAMERKLGDEVWQLIRDKQYDILKGYLNEEGFSDAFAQEVANSMINKSVPKQFTLPKGYNNVKKPRTTPTTPTVRTLSSKEIKNIEAKIAEGGWDTLPPNIQILYCKAIDTRIDEFVKTLRANIKIGTEQKISAEQVKQMEMQSQIVKAELAKAKNDARLSNPLVKALSWIVKKILTWGGAALGLTIGLGGLLAYLTKTGGIWGNVKKGIAGGSKSTDDIIKEYPCLAKLNLRVDGNDHYLITFGDEDFGMTYSGGQLKYDDVHGGQVFTCGGQPIKESLNEQNIPVGKGIKKKTTSQTSSINPPPVTPPPASKPQQKTVTPTPKPQRTGKPSVSQLSTDFPDDGLSYGMKHNAYVQIIQKRFGLQPNLQTGNYLDVTKSHVADWIAQNGSAAAPKDGSKITYQLYLDILGLDANGDPKPQQNTSTNPQATQQTAQNTTTKPSTIGDRQDVFYLGVKDGYSQDGYIKTLQRVLHLEETGVLDQKTFDTVKKYINDEKHKQFFTEPIDTDALNVLNDKEKPGITTKLYNTIVRGNDLRILKNRQAKTPEEIINEMSRVKLKLKRFYKK